MKVCITARSGNLDSDMDPHFGRASHFLLVESDSLTLLAALPNEELQSEHGAGIRVAGKVLAMGADVCISGSFGPKAWSVLDEGNIRLYTAQPAPVKDIIRDLAAGNLKPFSGNRAGSE